MHTTKLALALAALPLAAGCGGAGDDRSREAGEPPMKVEDTVVGDLVTAPERVEDRTNAAMDGHREALESRIEADEGAPPEE
jgi:hypothetical protein